MFRGTSPREDSRDCTCALHLLFPFVGRHSRDRCNECRPTIPLTSPANGRCLANVNVSIDRPWKRRKFRAPWRELTSAREWVNLIDIQLTLLNPLPRDFFRNRDSRNYRRSFIGRERLNNYRLVSVINTGNWKMLSFLNKREFVMYMWFEFGIFGMFDSNWN